MYDVYASQAPLPAEAATLSRERARVRKDAIFRDTVYYIFASQLRILTPRPRRSHEVCLSAPPRCGAASIVIDQRERTLLLGEHECGALAGTERLRELALINRHVPALDRRNVDSSESARQRRTRKAKCAANQVSRETPSSPCRRALPIASTTERPVGRGPPRWKNGTWFATNFTTASARSASGASPTS